MAIGALSSTFTAGHVPNTIVTEDAVVRTRQVSRNFAENTRGQRTVQNGTSETTGNARAEVTPQGTREVQQANASASSTIPHVQFKDSEGARVMEVYDSKSVLIYQVPPKGLLMLIHSQEHQTNTLVETSA